MKQSKPKRNALGRFISQPAVERPRVARDAQGRFVSKKPVKSTIRLPATPLKVRNKTVAVIPKHKPSPIRLPSKPLKVSVAKKPPRVIIVKASGRNRKGQFQKAWIPDEIEWEDPFPLGFHRKDRSLTLNYSRVRFHRDARALWNSLKAYEGVESNFKRQATMIAGDLGVNVSEVYSFFFSW